MLSAPPSNRDFSDRLLKHPDWTLAESLMNQSVVSGVGNYAKAEALYQAKLSPNRTIFSLTAIELIALNASIQDVLQRSYDMQGATIQTYRDPEGREGKAQDFFKVYGKDKDPMGHDVVKEATKDGRTTHWCPRCQT